MKQRWSRSCVPEVSLSSRCGISYRQLTLPLDAILILVAHLSEPHHPRIWEGIVRALSIKRARDLAFESLKRFYVAETVESRRWLLANAIGAMAKFTEVKDLPGIKEYRVLFNKPRKPPHLPPAI